MLLGKTLIREWNERNDSKKDYGLMNTDVENLPFWNSHWVINYAWLSSATPPDSFYKTESSQQRIGISEILIWYYIIFHRNKFNRILSEKFCEINDFKRKSLKSLLSKNGHFSTRDSLPVLVSIVCLLHFESPLQWEQNMNMEVWPFWIFRYLDC